MWPTPTIEPPPPPPNPQPERDYAPTSAEEQAYYDALFQVADTAGAGQIQGLQAVTFFKTSGLDVGVLKHVWALADSRQMHSLDREAFYVAMRLIALAQAGQPALTRERLLETLGLPLPYPRFQGVPVQPPPGRLAPLPPPAAAGADPYSMTPEERGRYLVHFAPCDVNGACGGHTCMYMCVCIVGGWHRVDRPLTIVKSSLADTSPTTTTRALLSSNHSRIL